VGVGSTDPTFARVPATTTYYNSGGWDVRGAMGDKAMGGAGGDGKQRSNINNDKNGEGEQLGKEP
jgi:hypothetical protein